MKITYPPKIKLNRAARIERLQSFFTYSFILIGLGLVFSMVMRSIPYWLTMGGV